MPRTLPTVVPLRLPPDVLAAFARPQLWREVLAVRPYGLVQWRRLIELAEADGLLTWCRQSSTWRLTDHARQQLAAV